MRRRIYHGMVSTLIVSPLCDCALGRCINVYCRIRQSGIGCGALFLMGLGMGIPLIAIGVGTGRWLPRRGLDDWCAMHLWCDDAGHGDLVACTCGFSHHHHDFSAVLLLGMALFLVFTSRGRMNTSYSSKSWCDRRLDGYFTDWSCEYAFSLHFNNQTIQCIYHCAQHG